MSEESRRSTEEPKLLQRIVPGDRANPNFTALATLPGYAPARDLLRSLYRKFPNPDGNFMKDFQSTGFDRRIWELYLWAAFNDVGFKVKRPHDGQISSLRM